jgi:RimJ/RimL family protein N-acetyltransferase
MTPNLFTGTLVRLTAQDPETDPALYARWTRDSEYLRFLDSDPARPATAKHFREHIEQRLERPNNFGFAVRTLADDRLIGFVALWLWSWPDANAGVGIGMGDPDYRGKGYGTDTMQVALRYAFNELNVDRVTLQAAAHNARGIRSYQKAGFVLVGHERELDLRDGQRNGVVTMTATRDTWTNPLGDTLLAYLRETSVKQ